ncbi:MAG TPA: hypothetical protein VLE44_00830 [Candidatus Saccharimonadales bacterium]|nr:hypothetical protein [Candidatus Saccharimonadales bacterium]
MSGIDFLIGDGTRMGSDAYFQAVLEGMVDPSMSLDVFNLRSKHQKVNMKTIKEEEKYYDEVAESCRNVYPLLKNPTAKEEILNKWFGSKESK